jgi:uncharacterized damage-inducible protein DinB
VNGQRVSGFRDTIDVLPTEEAMPRHPLDDAFRHNTWATVRIIDACADLTPDQLAATAEGTRGSVIDTLRHVVGSDSWYLSFFRDEGIARVDDGRPDDLPDLRAAMIANGALWLEVLAAAPDPDRQVEDVDAEWRYSAPVGVRLAQVVHHGTDHRSQVCTILTTLGIEPPEIDVWAYADQTARSIEEKLTPAT